MMGLCLVSVGVCVYYVMAECLYALYSIVYYGGT